MSRVAEEFNLRLTLLPVFPKTSMHLEATVYVCVCDPVAESGFYFMIQSAARPLYLQWKTKLSLSHADHCLPLKVPEATKTTRQAGLTQAHTDTDTLSDNTLTLRFVFDKAAVSQVTFCFMFSFLTQDFF